MTDKARILLIGGGGIGTVTALNLEQGGRASVTVVLRSNYQTVKEKGFKIVSVDHGEFEGWRPTEILNQIPDVAAEKLEPFEFVLCTTKNLADVPPTVVDLIKPAVTPGYSVIVLIQNGLNIEKPVIKAFPQNVCLSGVSRMGADELALGYTKQDDPDRLFIAPFTNPNIDQTKAEDAAKRFVEIYSASGKADCKYEPDVPFVRWRKLMYNAVWNPICALTDMDTSRIRLASDPHDKASPVDLMVRPAMQEIIAAAKAAANVDLPEALVEDMVECDPIDLFGVPSMQQDARKKRFLEFENILGEALREGEAAGVNMPTVKVLYALCKARQWKTREQYGMVDAQEELKKRQAI